MAISDRIENLDATVRRQVESARRVIGRSWEELEDVLAQMDREMLLALVAELGLDVGPDGRIRATTANLAKIEAASSRADSVIAATLLRLGQGKNSWIARTVRALEKQAQDAMRAEAGIIGHTTGWDMAVRPEFRQFSARRIMSKIEDLGLDNKRRIQSAISRLVTARADAKTVASALTRPIEEGGVGISMSRARVIVDNEEFATYRQYSDEKYVEAGYEIYIMVGPDDIKTCEVCDPWLGLALTRDQWLELEPAVFEYGFHPNCRHRWPGVDIRDDPEMAEAYEAGQEKFGR